MTTHLTAEYVPTDSLRLHPDNPRRGDIGSIKASLERNGQYRAIVVSRPTMEVLAGNHTLLAARQLGWQEIAATFVDVDSEQARRILLVDNRTNDLAGYDSHALAELLGELPDLEGTGYDDAALAELLDEVAPAPVGEDEPPPLPEEPETRPGDLLSSAPTACSAPTPATPRATPACSQTSGQSSYGPIPPTASSTKARRRRALGSRATAPQGSRPCF